MWPNGLAQIRTLVGKKGVTVLTPETKFNCSANTDTRIRIILIRTFNLTPYHHQFLAFQADDRMESLTMASILLVEDDDQLRTMLKGLLTSSGYEVWDAPDGTRVCDMYQQQRFDLVITDLVMPDIDGLALIMELRRLDQSVRIIAVSGAGQRAEEYLGIAQKLGAQRTLRKPFGNEQFLEAVRLALES